MIVWGDSKISWEKLLWTAHWTYGKSVTLPAFRLGYEYERLSAHLDSYIDRHISDLRVFYRSTDFTPSTLLYYLGQARSLEFKDRRDCIYAFLDLPVTPTQAFTVTPDYTRPRDIIFKDFAIQYLEATGDQTVLSFVVHDIESLESGLPSWVPRWDALEPGVDDRFWGPFAIGSRSVEVTAIVKVLDKTTLKLRCARLERIRFVSEAIPLSRTSPTVVRELWDKLRSEVLEPSDKVAHSFAYLLDTLTWRAFERFSKSRRESLLNAHTTSSGSTDSEVEDNDAEDRGFNYLHGIVGVQSNARRLVVTETGYFGLGPAIAQKGDTLARLFGSKALPREYVFLLRGTDEPMRYKFVGPAWIHYHAEDEFEEEGSYADVQDIYLC